MRQLSRETSLPPIQNITCCDEFVMAQLPVSVLLEQKHLACWLLGSLTALKSLHSALSTLEPLRYSSIVLSG